MEIPKDGRDYLCWHREVGIAVVQWNTWKKRFEVSLIGYPDDLRGSSGILRWMNERGVWHEVDNGNT